MGPYLPDNFKGHWTDLYINELNNNNIKLFGSTINTCMDPLKMSHVQSYIFTMDNNTLVFLIECQIFSITNYAKTFNDAIYQKEVLMSRKVIDNNWNIGSFLEIYKGCDFTFHKKNYIKKQFTIHKTNNKTNNKIKYMDDIMYPQYRNKLWTDKQLVFIKGNRIGI